MVTLFKVWSRMAAVSVTVALIATPLVSAQTPNNAPTETPARALLSETAFARLVHTPRADVAKTPTPNSPRPSLLRQTKAEMARQAQAPTATPAPRPGATDRSWMGRHKWYFIVPAIAVGGFFGTWGLLYAIYGDD